MPVKCSLLDSLDVDFHMAREFSTLQSAFKISHCHCRSISLTHSLTHSLTPSLTPSLTDSLTHWPTHSLTPSLTHSLTHSHSLTHTLTHSHTHSLTHSLKQPDKQSNSIKQLSIMFLFLFPATLCLPDWHEFNSTCYYFGNIKLSWYAAASYCSHNDTTLAMIDGPEENAFLADIV